MPTSCTSPEPVCGCDGKNYASLCETLVADVGVTSMWACGQPPANETLCKQGVTGGCGSGQFCNGPCGGDGVCSGAGLMQSCSDSQVAMSGCNGKLYGNDCGPSMSGSANVPAGESSIACTGGPFEAKCASGSLCLSTVGSCAGLPGFAGHCMPAPAQCPANTSPVCACDGVTYDNACFAVKAGTSAYAAGACAPGFQVCSAASPACPNGSYCKFLGCGPDVGGVRAVIPSSCPTGGAPVCGCPGVTYANECLLEKAQAWKQHDGACP